MIIIRRSKDVQFCTVYGNTGDQLRHRLITCDPVADIDGIANYRCLEGTIDRNGGWGWRRCDAAEDPIGFFDFSSGEDIERYLSIEASTTRGARLADIGWDRLVDNGFAVLLDSEKFNRLEGSLSNCIDYQFDHPGQISSGVRFTYRVRAGSLDFTHSFSVS